MTGLSSARHRDRSQRKPRCVWPECRGLMSGRYPNVPLCDPHVGLVATTKQWIQEREAEAALARQNEMARRNGLPEIAPITEPLPGDIYYLRIGEHIKIGHSRNVERRLRSYGPADILVVHPGSKGDEQALHGQFHAFLAAGREWFAQAPELMAHIDAMVARYGKPPADLVTKRPARPNRQAVTLRSRSGGSYGRAS